MSRLGSAGGEAQAAPELDTCRYVPLPPPRPAPPRAEPALTARPRSRLADTPDLVLDLPARAADAADAFALNRDTLRRRPAAGRAPEPGGSPVPARNTLRVAAKFAELTLTGGSLKPALAAKPALLRRPTPHPRAPAAPPPAAPDAPP
ncbi:translation initiation factor IF-2-like [Melitaea cinxia]|uniref:translation initiation factor IF-2-like n=1 Tax=Melitaea cinxia TaxID=113334 RepID=UPI001E2713E3|nr:translation initiation factor IF-2-like [Melitaea cinxia]